jgi:hypothetical protein
VEGCAERIVQLVGDPELQRTIGRAAREVVRDRFLTVRELEDYLGLMTSLR